MAAAGIWWQAARPKTLWAAVAPVAVGTALAARDGQFHAGAALCALAGALFIQIATNFWNDYADFMRGADTAARTGPRRAVAAGLVAPGTMRAAALLTFGLAALSAVYLIARAGWPVLALWAVSILCGILYTSGPRPLAYVGLGDLFVLVFFGFAAVAGTYFVQARAVTPLAAWAGLGPGLLSVAVLVVNNLRDVETDRLAGKRTLAVRWGPGFARAEYTACVLGAAATPFLLSALAGGPRAAWAAALVLPAGLPALRAVHTRSGSALNPVLAQTALLLLLYSATFAGGCLL